MKNVIIFGGAGFIGVNLIKRLLDNGDKVLCVDNLYTGFLTNIELFFDNKNFRFVNKDITNEKDIIELYDDIEDFLYNFVDEIYNFACPASPPKYQKNPLYTIDCSLAIRYICNLALYFDSKLLHSSTSEIYGDPDNEHHPQQEDYRGNVNTLGPRSCYDEGKRIAETIIYEYVKLGCKAKIIRIFNTYGPYMDPKDGRVISNFICQALQNKDITIYGTGTQTRSFQYIDDLLNGIMKMMETENSYMGPVNIGSPFEFTMEELAIMILELIPESKSKIIYKKLPEDDPKQRRADITKLYTKTGWEPKISLNEGLLKTIEYFRNVLNDYPY